MSTHQPDDLKIARTFLEDVSTQLGLDPAVLEEVMPHLLGLTKHVAHGVVRPAAPLAVFLIGLAAGTGDKAEIRAKIEQVEALVQAHADQQNTAEAGN